MDPTMILAIAIVSLALVLVAVGIYSIMVLRDVREAIKQVNKILGRVDSMAEHVDLNVIRPGSSLAGLLGILRDGAHLVNEIRHISQDVSQTAKTVSSEVKEVSQVVKEDLIPAVSNGAREVGATVREEATLVAKEVGSEAQATVHDIVTPIEAEPLKAGSLNSLSTPRRRFFSRRK